MPKSKIIAGGLVPFTTIDYPRMVSCVVFLQGCPWRCSYCSNPHLFEFRAHAPKDSENWRYILDLLARRTKVLDAVVFSGGEATAQAKALAAAIDDVHAVSPRYKIGLHTNGCRPEQLAEILPRVDWVGLDIKAPLEKYDSITKVDGSGAAAFASLDLVLQSGVDFEVRTTADPSVLGKDDILALGGTLAGRGVKSYALQRYRPINGDDPKNPPIQSIMQFFADKEFADALKGMFPDFQMRF
ncbi:MAG: anaerobic ribonucleoside-triphosphate reductase activating protein [Rickettsiales bacterium]|jgi:anaerobic ribonucleoside-triphosphate reductase activating protein|nr:anaerobic ribonucleoside-triphosphate reductase activating protein [Rickettsiales bacterium]